MPYIFGISGRKNTGKTKIVCEIVKELSERGYDVATIKHDGHEFEPDRPGTDTFRHLNAGAFGTAIFSETVHMIVKKTAVTAEQLALQFPEADVILIEGMKRGTHPKFETVRDYGEVVSAPETIQAVIANEENTEIRKFMEQAKNKVPLYTYSDILVLCDIIEAGIRQQGSRTCQKIQ